MRQKLLYFIFVLTVFFGCQGEYRPPGLPKLMPCAVTVIDIDGTPLSGAAITLFSPDVDWAAVGMTDANGVAEISVNNQFKGAPAGRYKVVIYKRQGFCTYSGVPDFPPHVLVDVRDQVAYFINPRYSQPDRTPFEIEVIDDQPAKATFTLEKRPRDR